MTPDVYLHADEVPGSIRAAERIVPVVLEVTGRIRSVVDVGGGSGAWLQVFRRLGVEETLLLDGAEVKADLLIEEAYFEPVDLNIQLPAPRRFDLAVCVECAEHLQAHRAEPLVDWLTTAADVVVFSAAISGQGGKGHINERPPEYWRDLFHQHGFIRRDLLRPRIIHDVAIPWWYRQNLFLFVKPTVNLSIDAVNFLPDDFHLVHRRIMADLQSPSFLTRLRQLGPALISAIRRRLRREDHKM